MYDVLVRSHLPMTAQQVAVMAPYCAAIAQLPSMKWGNIMLERCKRPESLTAVNCVNIMARLGLCMTRSVARFNDVETLKMLQSGFYNAFKPDADADEAPLLTPAPGGAPPATSNTFFPMTPEQLAVMASLCAPIGMDPRHKWGAGMVARCQRPELLSTMDCLKIITRLALAKQREVHGFDDAQTLLDLKSGMYDAFKPVPAASPPRRQSDDQLSVKKSPMKKASPAKKQLFSPEPSGGFTFSRVCA